MAKPRKMPNEELLKEQAREIRQLRDLCGELYQIIGQFVAYDEDDSLGLVGLLDDLNAASGGAGWNVTKSRLPWHLPDEMVKVMERFTALKQLEKSLEDSSI